MIRRLILLLGAALELPRLFRGARPRGGDGTPRPTPSMLSRPLLPGGLSVWQLLWTAVMLAFLAAIGGAVVLVSGIVPVKASAGHWGITRAILNFASARSVWTHSLGIDAPRLDDPALIMRGAGHYEGGCRACHGTVTGTRPPIAAAMTPPPPSLPEAVTQWTPRELFYIVKHGIKMTGMPAWLEQRRDDEVWAVVAFLRTLPTLDEQGYRDLVGGEQPATASTAMAQLPQPDVSAPTVIREACARCHGLDGLGRGVGAFPKLAGQPVAYLEGALRAYANGSRHSGIMKPVAAALTDETIRQAATYYAGLPLPAATAQHAGAAGEDEAVRRGQALATGGIGQPGVPACVHCHGSGGHDRNPAYPTLAGQPSNYLRQQLRLFRSGDRGGSEYAPIMRKVAGFLSDAQIDDLARYFASPDASGAGHDHDPSSTTDSRNQR